WRSTRWATTSYCQVEQARYIPTQKTYIARPPLPSRSDLAPGGGGGSPESSSSLRAQESGGPGSMSARTEDRLDRPLRPGSSRLTSHSSRRKSLSGLERSCGVASHSHLGGGPG